jgi:energy-coupling factor transporter ATP-binding protein EcfA2/ABC-type enterochelin transport system ATPase subunit
MATLQDDYIRISDELDKTSRFFRVALHVHSPESYDFPRNGDPDVNDKMRLNTDAGKLEFLRALQASLDLVAITDHMKCSYSVALSSIVAQRQNFAVLPGMEINVRLSPPLDSNRIHILAIFRPGTAVDHINRIFAGTAVESEAQRNPRTSEVTNVTLSEFVSTIRQANGICILAHVESTPTGIRCLWHQTAKAVLGLLDPSGRLSLAQLQEVSEKFKTLVVGLDVNAVEISKPEDRKHYSWTQDRDGRKCNVPVLLCLDAHCIEDLAKVERHCHIKMTTVSFDGLEAALKMPHTRIRFRNDLPTPPSPALLGVTLRSSKGAGFFEDALLAFSENLNCIIGPRGSGKSTFIDALRYVFGYNRALEEFENDPGLKKAIRARQEKNLKDTIIRVFYRLDEGTLHILEATYDPKSDYVTKVYTADGHLVGVDDVERCGQYPLRLFGWSEIETLGRDPSHQRDLVDRLIPGLFKLIQEREEIRLALRENAKSLLASANKLKELFDRDNQIVTHFLEYTTDFEQLNTPEMQTRFASLDFAKRKHRAIELSVQAIDEHLERRRQLDPTDLGLRISNAIQAAGFDVAVWWRTEIALESGYDAEMTQFAGNHSQAVTGLGSLRERLAQVLNALSNAINIIEQNIRETLSDDTQAQVTANQRAQAETRLARVTKARQDYLQEYGSFERTLKERIDDNNGLLATLSSKQLEISGARNTRRNDLVGKLNNFRTETFSIDLDFKSGSDRAALLEHLISKKFLSNLGVHHRQRKWPEILSQKCNPAELAQSVWNKADTALAASFPVDGQTFSFSKDDARELIAKRHPVSHHDVSDLCVVDIERLMMLLELDTITWDDLVHITLNGQPVEDQSPGQRSSAMLPLIALSQTTPLVIDQPEDNLDSRLVGGVVSNILASLKEKRQVIVATHNPNIVVLGDAEQVIVLDALDDRHGKVIGHGSIDLPEIADQVIDMLEGGRAAFCVRKERYNL